MGRKKKVVELEEVGKLESKQSAKSLIEDLKTKEPSVADKNRKKWEKLIIRTYKQQLLIDEEKLYKKLQEKFSSDEEVKNILSELKVKVKDLEYMTRKQWQILKKFNLQEKIYREEGRLLTESEKMKKDDIYKEAIEKLTAAHVGGFEPAFVLKSKILNKVQQKYDISDDIINEMKKLNYDENIVNSGSHSSSNRSLNSIKDPTEVKEEVLLHKRYEDQIEILEKFIQDFLNSSKDKFKDREYENMNNFHINKQELKRYEKEIELKAGKGAFLFDDEYYKKYEQTSNSNTRIQNPNFSRSIEKEKSVSKFELPNSIGNYSSTPFEDFDIKRTNTYDVKYDYDFMQNDILMNEEFPADNLKYDTSIKMKDILTISDPDNISAFKDKVVEDLREQAKESLMKGDQIKPPVYKSKILNDLSLKLTFFDKLTDFDLQILIYLSHVVVRDLVNAKIGNKVYEGMINPEELLNFLKKFKIDLQNVGDLNNINTNY